MHIPLLLALSLIAVSCIIIFFSLRRQSVYPPGPKGLPLLGVVREHPKTEFWRTYAQWGREYGNEGLISFHILGRRFVVVNSASVAEDLLDKRSAIYSDRPLPPMAGHLMRREKSIFYSPYNERFKMYRRLMQQGFNARAAQTYWEIEEHEAYVLLNGLLKGPEKLFEHLRRNASAVVMRIGYGYTVRKEHDHFVSLAEESMRVGSLAAAPGKWLVDSFPILRFLPDWFPGAGFKRQAKTWSAQLYTQSLEPHNYVKRELAAGTARPSFTSRLLSPDDGPAPDANLEDIILWTAGALYAGGADTTVSAMKTFFFNMMLHPDIQRRAQKEVDSIIGNDRLPRVQDRESLPYVQSILQEILRWGTVSPMALFHRTSADDEYLGYRIPAGSTVIPNIWAMMHDPSVYPNPFVFDPDRFKRVDGLREAQPDPRAYAFGFGRRVCPGQYIGEASIFIQIASVLATMDISKATDEWGRTIEPEVAFTSAIVSHIKPFKCTISPRRAHTSELVQQALSVEP